MDTNTQIMLMFMSEMPGEFYKTNLHKDNYGRLVMTVDTRDIAWRVRNSVDNLVYMRLDRDLPTLCTKRLAAILPKGWTLYQNRINGLFSLFRDGKTEKLEWGTYKMDFNTLEFTRIGEDYN